MLRRHTPRHTYHNTEETSLRRGYQGSCGHQTLCFIYSELQLEYYKIVGAHTVVLHVLEQFEIDYM